MSFKDDARITFSKKAKWYKERTKLERLLLLLSLFIFLLFSILLGVVIYKDVQISNKKVCLTPGCIHAASVVLKHLDESVNPCDDFYQFACGRFINESIIEEDKSSINSFSTVREEVLLQVKLLTEEDVPMSAIKPYHFVKKIYKLCMNTTALEEEGLEKMKNVLSKLVKWPLFDKTWRDEDFDWVQSIYKFREQHFSPSYFISCYTGVHNKNSTQNVIKIGEGYLPLSREYLIKGMNDSYVKSYYDYIVDIAVMFGADRDLALKDLKDVVEFEIKFSNLTLPREKQRNSTLFYNPTTIRELNQNYSFINWLELVNKAIRFPDIEITEDEVVIVTVPKFINDIKDLLDKTPKRTQANYAMIRSALSTVSFLPARFRNRAYDYYKIFSGSKEQQPRWRDCLGSAAGSVRLAIASKYIKKHFNQKAKNSVDEMITNIRASFISLIQNSDWMDDDTKATAVDKAKSVTEFIGYPHELLDDNNLDKFYSNLQINLTTYYDAMKSIGLFYNDYYLRKFRQPINKTDWLSHSDVSSVNAYYNSFENSIQFPAGILQGIFFDENRPHYMNYGGIGYIIGHEFTHGFDDRGRQYDKKGNLKDWWNANTNAAFVKKAQCIIDQYGNYTVPEVKMNLNGINTQGENIADNGGIKEAYMAYDAWVEQNGPEPKLPGLKYTQKQLFWISAANIWCSKARDEIIKSSVKTGAHSINRFRVIGPFSNSKFFAQDFNCPVGSYMNPAKKCEVW